VNRPIPAYLKLRSDDASKAVRPDLADLACLGELCQAFSEATGWPLRFVAEPEANDDFDLLWSAPVNPGVGVPPGHLRIDLSTTSRLAQGVRADWHACERMAGAVAELVNELVTARHALWQREAELAACVPVVSHQNEEAHLAERLTATLRAGAAAIGCQSAAVYLLDDSTSQLKLRSSWGLPLAKLAQPARPLAEQMVDLEALLGHAVALESVNDMEMSWRSPEPAEAALCVPISSPTVPLGTLWFFCDRQRPFTDDHTNLAEVVAGKIAADLERAALVQDNLSRADLRRQIEAAQKIQQHQFPAAPPPLAGWSISGAAEQSGAIGGAFYDWRMIDESSLLVMLGDSCESGIEAAIASSALRATLRSGDDRAFDLNHTLATANLVLWESGAGSWTAGLALAHLDLCEGRCSFIAAGQPEMIWLRSDGWSSLIPQSQPLGLDPTMDAELKRIRLHHGDSLLIYNRAIADARLATSMESQQSHLVRALRGEPDAPAERMVEIVRELLDANACTRDRSVLIVKRLANL
jgi:serine phosphatase RsbU (regulator of sigma subunit)